MNIRDNLLLAVILAAMSVVLPRAAVAGDAGAGPAAAAGMKNIMLADASGSITILSPKDGDTVDGNNVELKYNVTLSPTGNHIHVYVDRRRPIIDHDVTGCPCTLKLPMLGPGRHRVAMKEATVHHHLTGVGSTVTFTVK